MVKEKLKKALEDAVGYYNSGMTANDAVVKSASDHDLTIDQTDRIVESFNTAKTINYYDKNASDRTGGFDLASKKDVTLALFGNKQYKSEKKASSSASLLNSFYASTPDRSLNRKQIFAEKRASLLDILAKAAEEKWAHGYSDKTLQDMASDSYSVIKSASEDINRAITTIDNYLTSSIEKIATSLDRTPYGSIDKANLFKVACPYIEVIKEVSKRSNLLKKATGGSYAKTPVVDTSSIDDLLKEANDIMDAVSRRSELLDKKQEFLKKAEILKKTMFSDPSLRNIVHKEAADLIHAPTIEKKADLIDTSMVLDAVNSNESRKKVNERIRDDARGALLADLLSSDPILQDADPRQVSSIYKSLIATSPRISLNKEVVRSVLRGAVNSVAISPSDSKVLTDVDKGVQVAFGGLTDRTTV